MNSGCCPDGVISMQKTKEMMRRLRSVFLSHGVSDESISICFTNFAI